MSENTISIRVPKWSGALLNLFAIGACLIGFLQFVFEPRLDKRINDAISQEREEMSGKLTGLETAIDRQLEMLIAKENVKISDVRVSVEQIGGYVSSLRADMAAIKTDFKNTKESLDRVEGLLDQFIMSNERRN